MKKIFGILLLFSVLFTLSSCSSNDMNDNTPTIDEYMDLYQTACEALKPCFSGTRTQYLGVPVTDQEISQINNLRTLVTYDKERLTVIEESSTFQVRYKTANSKTVETKQNFVDNYSVSDWDKLVRFTESYIKAGTHNSAFVYAAILNEKNADIQKYMTLCAAVVDTYGEEEIWKETFKVVSLSECDKNTIIKVSLVLATTALNLSINGVIPWSAILTAASTMESICSLITIHNDWVRCKRAAAK